MLRSNSIQTHEPRKFDLKLEAILENDFMSAYSVNLRKRKEEQVLFSLQREITMPKVLSCPNGKTLIMINLAFVTYLYQCCA